VENAQPNDTQTNDNSMNDNTTENPVNDTQVIAADDSTTTDASSTEVSASDASSSGVSSSDAALSETTAQAAGDDANDAMTGAPSTEAPASDEAPVAERSGESSSNGSSNENAPSDMSTHAPADASATEASATEATPSEPVRPTRQPSMAQVMESDEFSSYMSGVDALTRGALLKGIVVRVDENTGEALVDIGTKSEGIIARNEIGDDPINVGDEVEVVVVKPEDDEGHPVVSKRRADYEKTWRVIQQAKDKNTSLEGIVREQVKGGLIVDLGVPAFVPASHVDARNRGDLSRFVGRTIPVRVIEIDRKKNKVIASHRQAAAKIAKSVKPKRGAGWKKTRSSKASCAASPTLARSLIWAASTACFMFAKWHGAASSTPKRLSRKARNCRS
jgi:predicted RNA-binding protein with RPS1 domain